MSTTEDLGPAKTFFAFMEAVLASDLTPSQRLVLLVQAKHADAHDDSLTNSFPSEETLAGATGLNRKTIQRTRKSLVEQGWLVQTHSGRGGSSKWANAYDLYIPDDDLARLAAARSKRQGVSLQSDTVSRQSDIESQAKRHSVSTSTPSSTPISAPAPAPSTTGGEGIEGKDGQRAIASSPGPVSYWVGHSKARPGGYFHRIDASTVEPKGSHVRVILSAQENMNIFGCYEYPEILKIMLEHAHSLGLREPARAATASSGSRALTREDRDKLYGLSPR